MTAFSAGNIAVVRVGDGTQTLIADVPHLTWRPSISPDGRWVAYENGKDAPFVGSLDACLKEIDHDRWGCFWG